MEEASVLGLNDAGIFGIFGWSMEDIQQFERGLNMHKRDFQRIFRTHLPRKDPQKIASFYYNVWKSKAIVLAIVWALRRDDVNPPPPPTHTHTLLPTPTHLMHSRLTVHMAPALSVPSGKSHLKMEDARIIRRSQRRSLIHR